MLNGQALCPPCNLSKGNKMPNKSPLTLRAWQARAKASTTLAFKSNDQFFLTHDTPAGGKTIYALSVFDELLKSGCASHVIVVAPSSNLVSQWSKTAKKLFDIDLKDSMLYNQMPDFREFQGMAMTYQMMNECHESLRIFCRDNNTLIISDEMHHLADGKSWGMSFHNAFEKATNILGLTGTPWASNGQKMPFVEYCKDGYAKANYTYGKQAAIADRVCRAAQIYPMTASNLLFVDEATGEESRYETLDDARHEKVQGAYGSALRSLSHMREMFVNADEQLTELRRTSSPRAGGLLVAPDIKTAHLFRDEIYTLTGMDYPIVHSKMPKSHDEIRKFNDSIERWIISVDMVTEGIDIPRLQVCCFLSQKNTELFFRQVLGRIERVQRKDVYSDLTAYFYCTDVEGLRDIIKRLNQENEAGIALRDEKEECISIIDDDSDRPQRDYLGVSLIEIDTALAGMVLDGFEYSKEVVAMAIKRKRSSAFFSDVPLFILCKVIMAEKESNIEQEATSYQGSFDTPMSEKKDRLRSRIAKELNRKLYGAFNRQPAGDEIKAAHRAVNKKVGMSNTDNSTSFDDLERKFQFINDVEVSKWQ